MRNVLERASARETTARVAAGGVARAFLRELGIECWSFTAEVGGVALDPAAATRSRDEADASPLRCPDPEAEARMMARIDEARSNGDTVGGVFEVVVHGLPIGLGSYVHWDRRLDAALAAAVMSINIVKGVEFGLGFEQTRRFGSAVHDVIARREARRDVDPPVEQRRRARPAASRTASRSWCAAAVKPISTLARPLPSADLITGEAGGEGALRALGHQRRAGGRRRRRGDGHAHPGRLPARQVRRRLDGRDRRQRRALPARIADAPPAPSRATAAAAMDRRAAPVAGGEPGDGWATADDAGTGGDD